MGKESLSTRLLAASNKLALRRLLAAQTGKAPGMAAGHVRVAKRRHDRNSQFELNETRSYIYASAPG